MSINFPTSLDSFTNPTANNKLNNPDHATVESNQNDAIVALEAKVGANSSAVTTSLDYKVTSTSSVSPGHKHASSDITDASSFLPTGMVLPYAGASAPSASWLICDGTAYSRSAYATLFALISTTYGVGDGINTFNIPDLRNRTILGVGSSTKIATFASRSTDTITVTGLTNASNNEFQTGQAVLYHTSAGVITGLSNDTTYYVIRVTNTSFKLASSLANAQNGTQISLSGNGSGTQIFTLSFTTRTLGDTGGEENHAQSLTELVAHTHPPLTGTAFHMLGGGAVNAPSTGSTYSQPATTGSTGGNVAMNIINPFLSLNYIIRI